MTPLRNATTTIPVPPPPSPFGDRFGVVLMCGIAGVLYADPARTAEPGALEALGAAIAHRGPDGEGIWREPGVGLVHRRLSIIDLAGGGQPLGNEDGSVQVVFNGEIYNYRELTAWLQARGHSF